MPLPITATVMPPPFSAPRWAAASIPRASPLTTITPARARSAPSCSATASPYGEGRREPTMATRGPFGGGHRPRALSPGAPTPVSSRDIAEPVAERLEDVPLADAVGSFKGGGCPRHAPGPVKAASSESALLRPTLQSLSRTRIEARQLAQARGFQLGVEASLLIQLPAACRQDALPYGRGGFALRF